MTMYYTVHRTQNIVSGKYYFGVHKTKNPYDDYLGSGKVIKRAIKKYGETSFIKNVCFIFDNPEEAFAKEFELIETYRKDLLCYNLRQGGSGGFDWINLEGFSGCKKGGIAVSSQLVAWNKNHPEQTKKAQALAVQALKLNPEITRKNQQRAVESWRGKNHAKEHMPLPPFWVAPRWSLAITRNWHWRKQTYVSGVGWTSFEWGVFRLYHHIPACECQKCGGLLYEKAG